MNKIIAFPNIDFADSEFIGFELINSKNLIVIVKNLEERILKINFNNPIEFIYKLGFQISELCEITDKSKLLEEALSKKYKLPYPENSYREFQFINIYNLPFIQIIADSADVLLVPSRKLNSFKDFSIGLQTLQGVNGLSIYETYPIEST